jgi:D-hexose-6-phosphate mutarotase
MITRWQVQGQDILYLDAERFADPTLTVRGGVPMRDFIPTLQCSIKAN